MTLYVRKGTCALMYYKRKISIGSWTEKWCDLAISLMGKAKGWLVSRRVTFVYSILCTTCLWILWNLVQWFFPFLNGTLILSANTPLNYCHSALTHWNFPFVFRLRLICLCWLLKTKKNWDIIITVLVMKLIAWHKLIAEDWIRENARNAAKPPVERIIRFTLVTPFWILD